MSLYYRPIEGQFVSTAKGAEPRETVKGTLFSAILEDDRGWGKRGIPPHVRLVVDLGAGIVVVRLWDSTSKTREPLDPFAERALMTLGACEQFRPCVAAFAIDREGIAYPSFSSGGTVKVPADLKGLRAEEALLRAEEIVARIG